MKVTKAQAQANRAHVVETASTAVSGARLRWGWRCRPDGRGGLHPRRLLQALPLQGRPDGGVDSLRHRADRGAGRWCGRVRIRATLSLPRTPRQPRNRLHDGCAGGGCRASTGSGTGHVCGRHREPAGCAEPEEPPLDGTEAAQARTRFLDLLAHAVGAIVLSRACPDESPLADEILSICRDKILTSLGPSATAR